MFGQELTWRPRYERSGSGLKSALAALMIIAAVSLAILAGKEMSSDAVGVVIGVVCGVAAGIPSALVMLAAVGRRGGAQQSQPGPSARSGHYPPVVVIQGGSPHSLPGAVGYSNPPAPYQRVERRFHVVGGSGQFLEDGSY